MKKFSKIAYIVLIIIMLLSGFFIYKVSGKNQTSQEENDKCLAGIKQLDSKFVSLFNDLNNISFDNYKLSETQIKEEQNNSESQSNSSSEKSTNGGSNSNSTSDSSQEKSNSQEQNKKFNMESNGILTGNQDPDWNKIKNEVENMYTFLYSNLIDLYKNENNQENIVNFNKEFDNLTRAVKTENKQDTLTELSSLYDYLPDIVENCTESLKERTAIKTKSYIFRAYSILDQDEWDTMADNINNATEEFTKLVTNVENKENLNQYNVNKIYIMINELQNAINLRDREVFLIKYKNLLEELQNL